MEPKAATITTIHPDRRYQNCLCCACGKISICTPDNDFYGTEDHGEKLVCEQCFKTYAGYRIYDIHTCQTCGGTMLGDGHATPRHCEFTGYPEDSEPDSGPYYCEAEESR